MLKCVDISERRHVSTYCRRVVRRGCAAAARRLHAIGLNNIEGEVSQNIAGTIDSLCRFRDAFFAAAWLCEGMTRDCMATVVEHCEIDDDLIQRHPRHIVEFDTALIE